MIEPYTPAWTIVGSRCILLKKRFDQARVASF
jgi:hypothetical protein